MHPSKDSGDCSDFVVVYCSCASGCGCSHYFSASLNTISHTNAFLSDRLGLITSLVTNLGITLFGSEHTEELVTTADFVRLPRVYIVFKLYLCVINLWVVVNNSLGNMSPFIQAVETAMA